MLNKLGPARGLDSWCWPKGSWPLGTRMWLFTFLLANEDDSLSSDWFLVLFSSVVIDHSSDYFGFSFTTLNWKIVLWESKVISSLLSSWVLFAELWIVEKENSLRTLRPIIKAQPRSQGLGTRLIKVFHIFSRSCLLFASFFLPNFDWYCSVDYWFSPVVSYRREIWSRNRQNSSLRTQTYFRQEPEKTGCSRRLAFLCFISRMDHVGLSFLSSIFHLNETKRRWSRRRIPRVPILKSINSFAPFCESYFCFLLIEAPTSLRTQTYFRLDTSAFAG